jgi:hypothetical protein
MYVLLAVVLTGARGFALGDDGRAWLVLTGQGRIAPNIRLFGEIQPRLTLPGLSADSVIWRGAVGRDLTPSTSVWVGYGWMPQYGDTSFGGGYRSEQRGFLQLLSNERRWGGGLVNRTRFEDRHLEGADPSYRLRHMLRYTHPLSAGAPWSWAASDELFVTLNEGGGRKAPAQGFDQNRVFAGIDRSVGPFTLEVGYLLNFVRQPTKPDDLARHVLLLSVAWSGA